MPHRVRVDFYEFYMGLMQPLISNLNMFDVRRKVTRGSKHGKISKLSAELRDTSNFFSANSPMCDRPYKSCEQLYINSFIFFSMCAYFHFKHGRSCRLSRRLVLI